MHARKIEKTLKSILEISKFAKVSIKGAHPQHYKIYHSSGSGGGLHVRRKDAEFYFGTGRIIKVQFHRAKRNRNLYMGTGSIPILYDEWFTDTISTYLDDDLFEI